MIMINSNFSFSKIYKPSTRTLEVVGSITSKFNVSCTEEAKLSPKEFFSLSPRSVSVKVKRIYISVKTSYYSNTVSNFSYRLNEAMELPKRPHDCIGFYFLLQNADHICVGFCSIHSPLGYPVYLQLLEPMP